MWCGVCAIEWAAKWKNDILKCTDVDYYGTMYIKQGSIKKKRIFKILAGCFYVLKFLRTFYNSKNVCLVYRIYGTQNNQLELTVSAQKSVLKNMHWLLTYQPKCPTFYKFGWNQWVQAGCFEYHKLYKLDKSFFEL